MSASHNLRTLLLSLATACLLAPIPEYTRAALIYGLDSAGGVVSLDIATGTRTSVGAVTPFSSGARITFGPDGLLYGSSGFQIGRINVMTGAFGGYVGAVGNPAQFAGNAPFAFGTDGRLYAMENDGSVAAVTLATGVVSIVSDNTFNPQSGLAFAPNGLLYGLDTAGGVVSLDVATGTRATVGTVTPFSSRAYLAFGPDGLLYGSSDFQIGRIDVQTATFEGYIGAVGSPPAPAQFIGNAAFAFGPDGRLYAMENDGGVAAVDPSSGAVSLISHNTFNSNSGLAFTIPSAVPEPATWSLLAVSLLLFFAAYRRRFNSLAIPRSQTPFKPS